MSLLRAAEAARRQVGGPYVYGATGKACTPGMRKAQCRQYPKMEMAIRKSCPVLSGKSIDCLSCRHRGRLAFDCAQLTRYALREAGIFLPSGASSQWRFDGFLLKGPLTGEHARKAKTSVCLLFAADTQGKGMRHVGLSLGDGQVVDARSHQKGILQSPFSDYPYTHCAFFPEKAGLNRPLLQQGDRGPAVLFLQRALIKKGLPLPRHGADGLFGPETRAALVAFQRMRGLAPSGEVDHLTKEALQT